eukprot:scaffold146435_cov23-Prasinocladus_malaysianus.AAC.1
MAIPLNIPQRGTRPPRPISCLDRRPGSETCGTFRGDGGARSPLTGCVLQRSDRPTHYYHPADP